MLLTKSIMKTTVSYRYVVKKTCSNAKYFICAFCHDAFYRIKDFIKGFKKEMFALLKGTNTV